MGYATREDITNLSVSPTALGFLGTDVDKKAALMDAALDAATEEADAYLSKRFDLPITEWGKDLRRHVADMAAYFLFKRRGGSSEDLEPLKDGYEEALKWLKAVAKGEIDPTNIIDSSSSGVNSTSQAAPRTQPVMVVQPHNAGEENRSFWDRGERASFDSVGAPTRRGW